MVMDVATDRLCVLFKGEMIVQSNDESFDCIRGRNGRACNGGLTDSGRRQQIISPVSQKSFPWFPMMETVAYTAGAEMQSRLVALVGTGN